jgi:hypothetical protein
VQGVVWCIEYAIGDDKIYRSSLSGNLRSFLCRCCLSDHKNLLLRTGR